MERDLRNLYGMMVDTIIGIDPGAQGGIAVWKKDSPKIITAKMPKDVQELLDFLDYYSGSGHPLLMLEKVQVRPDDAAVEGGAVNMGKIYRIQKMLANFEHLRAVIDLSGIPYCLVHPMKWQARLCLRQKGEQKADRKKRYKEVAQKLYPDVKATMWNCDAILLMEFGRAMLSDLKGRKWILENVPKREHEKLF